MNLAALNARCDRPACTDKPTHVVGRHLDVLIDALPHTVGDTLRVLQADGAGEAALLDLATEFARLFLRVNALAAELNDTTDRTDDLELALDIERGVA